MALFGTFGVSTLASAQSPSSVPVILSQPKDWKVDMSDTSDRRIIAYVDPTNDNRIEILARNIVRDAHADTLFEAFHNQLTLSNFSIVDPSRERSFDLSNAQRRTGKWAEYSFGASEVPINIVTFSFTVQNTAFIIVGYFAAANRAVGIDALEAMIRNMLDKPEE